MWWQEYWAWLAAALVLAILEILLPINVLLGFALGAGAVGAGLFLGVLGASLPTLLVVFGAVSLVAWLVLRRLLGVRAEQVRRIDHDINQD